MHVHVSLATISAPHRAGHILAGTLAPGAFGQTRRNARTKPTYRRRPRPSRGSAKPRSRWWGPGRLTSEGRPARRIRSTASLQSGRSFPSCAQRATLASSAQADSRGIAARCAPLETKDRSAISSCHTVIVQKVRRPSGRTAPARYPGQISRRALHLRDRAPRMEREERHHQNCPRAEARDAHQRHDW